jgi:hypothetical protein
MQGLLGCLSADLVVLPIPQWQGPRRRENTPFKPLPKVERSHKLIVFILSGVPADRIFSLLHCPHRTFSANRSWTLLPDASLAAA